MSIPLDNLYHYIEEIAQEVYGDVIIYRFYPHGSKNLENLIFLHDVDWYHLMTLPPLICHDQEPLNFDYYENYKSPHLSFGALLEKHGFGNYNYSNLKKPSIFDNLILVHSEKRSLEVEKYQDTGFIPVYYWSHAMISLDWFRFAKYINQKKQVKKTFLVYNRAWQGTREYRLKFVDLLIDYNLKNHCQTKFNCVDPDKNIHYKEYDFKNNRWKPNNDLSDIFEPNIESSNSSASFDLSDYESTEIEVVLETLFDDSRMHLTEKTLRPIACQQPFILVAPAGSLSYLQDYGFKTFDSIWDETYDKIEDPYKRLHAVANLMTQISNWDVGTKKTKLQEAQKIAQFNKLHFFSNNFFNSINSELKNNLKQSFEILELSNTSKHWLDRRKIMAKNNEIKKIITGQTNYPDIELLPTQMKETYFKKTELIKVLYQARKYYMRSQNIK